MTDEFTFNDIMNEGAIIDNRRSYSGKKVTLKDVLKKLAIGSEGFKSAVGYFYIEGFSEIIYSLDKLKEIKILMGAQTSPKTKQELIKAFVKEFNQIEENETTIPAIALFHELIKESKVLKIRAYFGEEDKFERLHSKAYLFLRDVEAKEALDRYKAGVIGSSNLTPSGLVGNTELNVIIDKSNDLAYLERWFDSLWEEGTEEFEKLRVADALLQAIEGSKFGSHLDEAYTYLESEEFFKVLIKYLKADYLFEDWKKSKLFQFQVVDTIRCLRLFKESNYRGLFLTSSVGLGKSYVACKVGEIYLRERARVLVIAPANLAKSEDQWPRYLKEFNLVGKVDLISMGELQNAPDKFFSKRVHNYVTGGKIKLDKPNNYGLIIVDEAHNYRNEDAYRTRNLKKIIDLNGDSKLMFLTATPINTSLDDLLNLIKLFHRTGENPRFDKMVRDLEHVIRIISNGEFENFSEKEKQLLTETQESIEKELFVKSTRETIKTDENYIEELKLFSGIDLRDISDPEVTEAVYTLHRNYKPIVNGIIDFISSLTAAHLRIVDPEKGKRLGGFFKWLLYKRFESSISAYYLTLKRLARKNERILLAIENLDSSYVESDYEDDIEINFNLDFRENLEKVIALIKSGKGKEHLLIADDLKKDIEAVNDQIKKLEPYAKDSLNFENDYKMQELLRILNENKAKKILLFTQYRDTLRAIENFLRDKIDSDTVEYVSSGVENKNRIIESFNDPESKLNLLFSTDTLAEGFNISGADIVINFDIPYNPVKIIQRIGRATRLDNPKEIDVINFKPDEDIDRELELVERMDLRIKDIIKFVGVEYRVWIDRENEIRELLKQRRSKDVNLYLEVVKSIRNDIVAGNFGDLEVKIQYTKPTLSFLQKAINRFGYTRQDVENYKMPKGNFYTILKGEKSLTIYYQQNEIFNEEALNHKEIEPIKTAINLQKTYVNEFGHYEHYLKARKSEDVALQFYSDKIDRTVNNILDLIESKKLYQLNPEINQLKDTLSYLKEKCGSTTEKVIKRIDSEIRKKELSKSRVEGWIEDLENSCTIREIQQKLTTEPSRKILIAFKEE